MATNSNVTIASGASRSNAVRGTNPFGNWNDGFDVESDFGQEEGVGHNTRRGAGEAGGSSFQSSGDERQVQDNLFLTTQDNLFLTTHTLEQALVSINTTFALPLQYVLVCGLGSDFPLIPFRFSLHLCPLYVDSVCLAHNCFLVTFSFCLKDELEPHERCIRKILEQKGRVIQIVYRLENSSDDVIEEFEDDEGFEAVEEDDEFELGADAESFFADEEQDSSVLDSVRIAWLRIQLGKS